jgi:uncharacterized protein affecting Mg2+/Co2+ transport
VPKRDINLFSATEELEQDAVEGGGVFDVQAMCTTADNYQFSSWN